MKTQVNPRSIDWYEDNIEEPIRDLVKFLRNNGVNTECSCGHDMYIQCQYIPDGSIQDLIKLLYVYFYDVKGRSHFDFEIAINIKVKEGHQYRTLDIKLLKE